MRTISIILVFASLGICIGPALAEVKTEELEYKQGNTPLKGLLAYEDGSKRKRPGVLVVHEWWGNNEFARNQAIKLAKAGYVAFALDMFGKVTTHPDEAKAFYAEITKNPPLMISRFNAALDLLKERPQVDPEKIAAVGYCFGGSVVLSMARTGADLDAVASFHGGLKPIGNRAEKGKVKAHILVMTGAGDPTIPKEQVEEFNSEMKEAGVKYEVMIFPGAKHAFTVPGSETKGVTGLAYNADADKKSWNALMKFLKQTLGKPGPAKSSP